MIQLKPKLAIPLEKLWKEHKGEEYAQYTPHALSEIPESGLLFIGINPSLTRNKEELKKLIGTKPNFGTEENKEHKYFKKFIEISEATQLPWGHLDIFYLRETSQNSVKDLLKRENGRDFLNQQWVLTKSILDTLLQGSEKRIVVVSNAFARDIIMGNVNGLSEGYTLEFDEKIGTYTYKNTIFFFTSMLTGQRALDKGSFERLIWHINFIKKLNKFK